MTRTICPALAVTLAPAQEDDELLAQPTTRLGKSLLQLFDDETERRGGSHTWGSHSEGLHSGHTGQLAKVLFCYICQHCSP